MTPDDALAQSAEQAVAAWGSYALTVSLMALAIGWLLSRNRSLEKRNESLVDQMFETQRTHADRMIGVLEKSQQQARALADAVRIFEKMGR